MIIGGFLLLPLIILPFYMNELKYFQSFLVPALVFAFAGFILKSLTDKSEKVPVNHAVGAIIVVCAWVAGWLAGAAPLYLSGLFNPTQALFESMSGWTTTGLTVALPDQLPHIILFWRSLMQYAGGFGFALMMMSMLISSNPSGACYAEGHTDLILPQLKKSANIIVKIYLIYLLAGSAMYLFAGMNVFDAVNHCMTALSTGGFSTHNDSIAGFKSLPIEIISIILMLLGATSFTVHHLIFSKKFQSAKINDEVKFMFATLIIFVALFFIAVMPRMAYFHFTGYGDIVRHGVFECVSALTTTGFRSISYVHPALPALVSFILMVLMCLGGHTNSTAGGIKQYRIAVFFRTIYWTIQEMFLPRTSVISYQVMKAENPSFIKEKNIREVLLYIALFVVTFVTGTLILVFMGNTVLHSMFEFASALSTGGLSSGITSPTASPQVLWVLLAGMFLGRLEFFIIIYVIVKALTDVKFLITSEDAPMHGK